MHVHGVRGMRGGERGREEGGRGGGGGGREFGLLVCRINPALKSLLEPPKASY